jgi:CPA2 family monovalent cation:H+ antiporter-2
LQTNLFCFFGDAGKKVSMRELDLVQDLAVVTFVAGISGFLCQKIGLSSIVGFLLAGLLVGPYTPPFALVDQARIESWSQLGLVFLMFSIGLDLSLGKLRRMGIGVVLAVVLGATLVFNLVRSICPLLHIGASESLFVGGMLIASSSAMIGKILPETGLIHQRAGNLAMSITVLEDLAAVVVFTFLSSFAEVHSGPEASLSRILGILLIFVTFVAVLGLLFLPPLLRQLNRAGTDLLTITAVGILLGIAVMAVKIGYSLALGAFLLGAIMAETPQRPAVERAMQGLRDVFVAVFFVSIGMLLEPQALLKHWFLILALGVLAIVVRFCALGFSLMVTGTGARDAIRTGLMVTPVGEFAFIIAQVGVSSKILSGDYYPIAVGVSLITALASPLLTQHSSAITDRVLKAEPEFIRGLLRLYDQFLVSVGERQKRSKVIGLARQRLPFLLVAVIFVIGFLVFAPNLFYVWDSWSPRNGWRNQLFWMLAGIAVAGPLLAAWRRFVEFLTAVVELAFSQGEKSWVLQICLEVVTALLLFLLVWRLAPGNMDPIWFFGAILVASGSYALIFGKELRLAHRRIEIELSEAILSADEKRQRVREEWLNEHQEWDLSLSELRVPDSIAWFGKSLGDLGLRRKFGCSVVGLDRAGYSVPNPGPDTVLYPSDILLVLGTQVQIHNVRTFIEASSTTDNKTDLLEEIRLESLEVPEESRVAGLALAELDIPRQTGVQIAGLSRGEFRVLFPGPFQVLEPGDWLLVVGTRPNINQFREWLG